jgi:MATE family multidrug resistance protein
VSATVSAAPARLAASVRRIAPLAWPVFVGQLAVLAFSTVDTVLVARYSAALGTPLELAALAVGAAAYITVFIGLMGVVLGMGPIVGQLFGAGRLAQAGEQLHQGVWLALGCSLLGSTVLAFPQPFLGLAQASPEVAERVRGYTTALAASLPAALLFTAYRGFNVAVSRPKAVMVLQLGGLALKVPLTAALVFGAGPLPALGVTGCGIATACAMWLQVLLALAVLRRDRFYDRFALWGRGLHRPSRAAIGALLRLGVPMGLATLIEVTGFSFMALFISRLGTTPAAGHQIAANLMALLFMLPLAIAHAGSTLVAQRIGAGDLADARRLGWHGLQVAVGIAVLAGGAVFAAREPIVRAYTSDTAVIAAALPLLLWAALFHVADAAQIVAAFVLRAWRVAVVPLAFYVVALWGVGLGGGYALAFDRFGLTPAAIVGAPGYWASATLGLTLAALALTGWLAMILRRQGRAARR